MGRHSYPNLLFLTARGGLRISFGTVQVGGVVVVAGDDFLSIDLPTQTKSTLSESAKTLPVL